jgi:hypothetical protein
MEEKFIEYIEKYYSLKSEYEVLQAKFEDLSRRFSQLIYTIIDNKLGNDSKLYSWDYNDLSARGIPKEQADIVVKTILEKRKKENED